MSAVNGVVDAPAESDDLKKIAQNLDLQNQRLRKRTKSDELSKNVGNHCEQDDSTSSTGLAGNSRRNSADTENSRRSSLSDIGSEMFPSFDVETNLKMNGTKSSEDDLTLNDADFEQYASPTKDLIICCGDLDESVLGWLKDPFDDPSVFAARRVLVNKLLEITRGWRSPNVNSPSSSVATPGQINRTYNLNLNNTVTHDRLDRTFSLTPEKGSERLEENGLIQLPVESRCSPNVASSDSVTQDTDRVAISFHSNEATICSNDPLSREISSSENEDSQHLGGRSSFSSGTITKRRLANAERRGSLDLDSVDDVVDVQVLARMQEDDLRRSLESSFNAAASGSRRPSNGGPSPRIRVPSDTASSQSSRASSKMSLNSLGATKSRNSSSGSLSSHSSHEPLPNHAATSSPAMLNRSLPSNLFIKGPMLDPLAASMPNLSNAYSATGIRKPSSLPMKATRELKVPTSTHRASSTSHLAAKPAEPRTSSIPRTIPAVKRPSAIPPAKKSLLPKPGSSVTVQPRSGLPLPRRSNIPSIRTTK